MLWLVRRVYKKSVASVSVMVKNKQQQNSSQTNLHDKNFPHVRKVACHFARMMSSETRACHVGDWLVEFLKVRCKFVTHGDK